MKKIYRVVKHTYYEKGEKKKSHYSVQYQTKFLWWKLWSTITETFLDKEGGSYNNPIVFHTESEAITMIKNLQRGNKIEGWDEEVTTVLELPV